MVVKNISFMQIISWSEKKTSNPKKTHWILVRRQIGEVVSLKLFHHYKTKRNKENNVVVNNNS